MKKKRKKEVREKDIKVENVGKIEGDRPKKVEKKGITGIAMKFNIVVGIV